MVPTETILPPGVVSNDIEPGGIFALVLDEIGYYVTEVGELNRVIHLWAYDALNQRDKCRAAMQADPDWAVYLAKNRPFMVAQEARVLKCAPFFVERLKKMLAATK